MTVKRRAGLLGVGIVALMAAGVDGASAQSSPPPTVLGVEITRPAPVELPRTGGDLEVAYVGAGLAGVGVILVLSARRRRQPAAS